jgi:hypothetical protein
MGISIKILESNKEIEKAISVALLPQIDKFMTRVVNTIKSNIFILINNAIISQPEYESLTSGTLRAELGIPDASIRIQQIIDRWISSAIVQYKPPRIVGNKIKTSLSVKIIKVDFSDVLSMEESQIKTDLGQVLPWLQWLLLEGTSTIIKDYEVVFGPNPRSRTGYAIMQGSSDSWGVPPEYSGTLENNWITRAIDFAKSDIQKLLEQALSQ